MIVQHFEIVNHHPHTHIVPAVRRVLLPYFIYKTMIIVMINMITTITAKILLNS